MNETLNYSVNLFVQEHWFFSKIKQVISFWVIYWIIYQFVQNNGSFIGFIISFKFQVLFVTYTTIQRLYNQQWNVSRVRSMDSANIEKYNTREVYIK